MGRPHSRIPDLAPREICPRHESSRTACRNTGAGGHDRAGFGNASRGAAANATAGGSEIMAGPPSSFDTAGSAARVIGHLLWYFVIPLAVIFVIVVGIAIASIFRKHRITEQEPLEVRRRP